MKFIEHLKLRFRANKYKNKVDRGGIAYLLSSIKAGDTVFDIGCHKAGYLYFMQQNVGAQGKAIAFEPQSRLYNYIVHLKVVLNWKNVTVEHLALSDSAGKVTLYIPSNKKSKASSPGATIVQHPERTDMELTEEVNTITLDAYCLKNNLIPRFLKIDVEGNELRVFKGAVETLKKHKPKILFECEARHIGEDKVMETFAFLSSLGYTGSFIRDTSIVPIKDFSFEKDQNPDSGIYSNNFIFE